MPKRKRQVMSSSSSDEDVPTVKGKSKSRASRCSTSVLTAKWLEIRNQLLESLEENKESKPKKRSIKKQVPENPGEGNEFPIENIVDKKIGDNGKPLYFIKWLGYSSKENTWEPIEHLGNSMDLVKKFEEAEEKKKRMPVKRSRNPDVSFGHTFRSEWLTSEAPHSILGSCKIYGIHYFLVRLKDTHEPDEYRIEDVSVNNIVVVRAKYFRGVFPELVIKHHEENFKFINKDAKKREKPPPKVWPSSGLTKPLLDKYGLPIVHLAELDPDQQIFADDDDFEDYLERMFGHYDT